MENMCCGFPVVQRWCVCVCGCVSFVFVIVPKNHAMHILNCATDGLINAYCLLMSMDGSELVMRVECFIKTVLTI